MKATVKRHKPTGALVWFPNDGMTGVVIKDGYPWKRGMTSSHWSLIDLEATEIKVEIKLKVNQQ